jgi:hypothetical protein
MEISDKREVTVAGELTVGETFVFADGDIVCMVTDVKEPPNGTRCYSPKKVGVLSMVTGRHSFVVERAKVQRIRCKLEVVL